MPEIRAVAKGLGIKPGNLSKMELVRTIQKTEGNFDCFATATAGKCDQMGCQWRDDCFKTAKSLAVAS